MKDEVPQEVYELMRLYPQTLQPRPGVEYLPHPIQGPPRAPRTHGLA